MNYRMLAMVVVVMAMGCSDDGVYTPVEAPDAAVDAPEQACDDKAGCLDAGDDANADAQK